MYHYVQCVLQCTEDLNQAKQKKVTLLRQNCGRWSQELMVVGCGGAVVSSVPYDRRVAGSNPTLAAAQGPWASPSLAIACSVSACFQSINFRLLYNKADKYTVSLLQSGASLSSSGLEEALQKYPNKQTNKQTNFQIPLKYP